MIATAPATSGQAFTQPSDLRPGAWVRQMFGYQGQWDRTDRDVIWHRYSGRLVINEDGDHDIRAYCGQIDSLPHDVKTKFPLLVRLEVSESTPQKACKNCLRTAS